MIRRLPLILLALSMFAACKKDAETPEAGPVDVQPQLQVKEARHFEVRIQQERELRRETFKNSPVRRSTANLRLTIRPEGDEYHFLWTNPDVESLPVSTAEEQETYKIEWFNSLWSPSFAVSKDGRFLRVLEQDRIAEGFKLATERAIEQSEDPVVARQIASQRDPVDVMTDIGVRRWNELGGAFVPYEFTYGTPIDVELGTLEASEESTCGYGKCFNFTAETTVSSGELQDLTEQLAAMEAEILDARRTLTLSSEVGTMVPANLSTELIVEMTMVNNEGAKEKGGTTIRENVTLLELEEAPKRAVLPELPPEPETADAGSN